VTTGVLLSAPRAKIQGARNAGVNDFRGFLGRTTGNLWSGQQLQCSDGQSTSPTSTTPNWGKVGPLLGAAGAE
jgi:hypothetical protein